MSVKNKAIEHIEEQMLQLDPHSFRYKTLEAAKDFKNSWIVLGQHLYGVYKDKLYKDWGFMTFEVYCAKEVGIRQNTAVKLLKSYYFLEKEEPDYIKEQRYEKLKPSQIPSCESVNALRLAKNNEHISEEDYEEIREQVLDKAQEEAEVKKKIRYILKTGSKSEQTQENNPADSLKKLALYLSHYKSQMSTLEVSPKITKKIDELLELLEDYLK